MNSPLTARVSNGMVRWRWLLFAVGAAVAAVSVAPARQLSFDRSIENMFAEDDPVLPPYRHLKRTFGAGESVLAAYDDPELMTPAGIERVAETAGELEQVPGVASVVGLHSFMGPAIVDPSPINRLGPRLVGLFEGFTHGADRRTAALLCVLKPAKDHRQTVAGLREAIERRPSGVIAGEPVMVVDGFQYLEEDGRLLGWLSTILLTATIVYSFRSLRWVVIPIAVVQLTLLLTQAVLVWSGLSLSMVSSMLTAIITVVAVAAVIHIIVRFRELRQEGLAPREALVVAGQTIVAPVVWSCLTDAMGFGSLLAASVGPVRDFGAMTGIGSLLVMASIVFLVPSLALAGRIDADPKRAWGESKLDHVLARIVHGVEHRPKTLAVLTIVASALAAAGAVRLEVETDFTKNFRASSPVVRSYEFIESRLGGAGVWDVILPAPRQLDEEYLDRVHELQRRLRTEVVVRDDQGRPTPGLTHVLSMADVVEAMPPGAETLVRISGTSINRVWRQLRPMLHREDPDAPGRYYYRIMLRSRERQPSAQKRELIRQVQAVCDEEFGRHDNGVGDSGVGGNVGGNGGSNGGGNAATMDEERPQVTGFFILLTRLIDSVVRDQWLTFGVATLAVGLTMIVAFRSVPLALVALVPNALPVFVVTGLLGWSGLKMNMGAAMIAAVTMGLSVDSSIHYIAAYLRHRGDEASVRHSLDAAHQGAGRAAVFSTLALVVGFSALCFSQFVPTIYFGVLVALAMLGGLAGNLVVLPLLLRMIAPGR